VTTTPHPSGSAAAVAIAGNVADMVRHAADAGGERPALIADQGSRTWSELDAAVDAGTAALVGAGYPAGERVVLAMPTGPDLAAALFAVLRAGLVAVPVDPVRTDLAWVARRVAAVAAVTDQAVSGAAAVIGSEQVGSWWGGKPTRRPARSGGEDLALLARAARSGPPVMLSHRSLLGAVTALAGAARLDVQPVDRVLQVLPLFHVVGLVTAFLPAAAAGAAVVIPGRPAGGGTAVEAALAAVREQRVSVLPAEPTLYRQLHRVPGFERALASVRLMTSGSSPLDPADFAAIRRATGQAVREGYGISESAAAIASTLMTDEAHPGSVGLPYAGVQVRILDDHDEITTPSRGSGHDRESGGSGEETPGGDENAGDSGAGRAPDAGDLLADTSAGGEVGPIAIRGDTLFSGYWPDGHGGPGADGWFVTGDIGYLDDAGELHLVDRAAETITVAGFTVYPREVEDILVEHPYVADAAVVGVPGRGGITVVAALVAQPGTRPTAADLDDYLNDLLPPFMRPTDYELVDVLPRTEVGRLDGDTVRQEYAQHRGIALDAPVELRAARGGPAAGGAVDTPDGSVGGVAGSGGAAGGRSAGGDGSLPGGGEDAGRPAGRDGDSGGAADMQAARTGPETAAGLDKLGIKLPADGSRSRRSAQDTDDDLF
jgi:long-chain acyl-CoA synthetase